jgi:hypothetical protein
MANELKFTPGPWFTVNHPPSGWTIQTERNGGGSCIAQAYGDSSIDNAALIAAAPDLYAVLQKLFESPSLTPEQYDAACAAGRKALAKARGEA